MLKKMTKVALSLALLVGFVGVAQAEMTREEYAVKFRRSSFTTMTWYLGTMSRMVKGEMPYDKAVFARNAENVAFLSKLPKDGFIPGSEGGDTKAKPEIWSKADKFKEANDNMEKETAKLAELAKSGNFDALKDQYGKMQKTCKACHEEFKKKAD
jgi:cytochrome c556